MRDEVKNCPKCGEPSYNSISHSWFGGQHGVGCGVTCNKCGHRYDTWHNIEYRRQGVLVIIPRPGV